MSKKELEIIECALVQLLMKYDEERKEIRKILNKVHDKIKENDVEVIE